MIYENLFLFHSLLILPHLKYENLVVISEWDIYTYSVGHFQQNNLQGSPHETKYLQQRETVLEHNLSQQETSLRYGTLLFLENNPNHNNISRETAPCDLAQVPLPLKTTHSKYCLVTPHHSFCTSFMPHILYQVSAMCIHYQKDALTSFANHLESFVCPITQNHQFP